MNMMITEKMSLPGLIGPGDGDRNELHGFEIDMSGQVVVPEFNPCSADELNAFLKFESELRQAI